MPLRTQIFFIFLAITITAITIASYVHYQTARKARLEELHNHLASVSQAKKLRMEGIIRKRKEQLLMLQLREQLLENFKNYQNTKSPALQSALARALKVTTDRIPSYLEIHLLSMQGTVVLSSSPRFEGRDFSTHESFQHAVQGELCLHEFFYDQNNKLNINMAGLLTLAGENIGVVVIKSDAEDVLSLINDYTGLGKSGETTLAKKLGEYILYLTPTRFHRNPDTLLVKNELPQAMTSALEGKDSLFLQALDYRDQPVVASTRFLEETEWGLVTKIDREEALASVREILYQTLYLALALIVAVAIAAHFFAQRLIRPVLSLRDTTREIAGGNLEKRISYSSRNEVGQLALNFNLMADKLVESNKMLERKIGELDRNNDSLNRFAYVVSHDLKSPLHAISALINALQETLANNEDPEVPRMLKMAEGKARHMLDLIAGILHYSMSGVLQENREPVPLKPLVQQVIQQLEVPEHISIEVGELPVVLIERVLILQVFQNLINNAIKYMDKPLGRIEVGYDHEADYIRFYVRDNGRGIERRNFEKIFDIFNKTHKIPGIDSSGIGLSIVKKIIETKGGRVWVESEIGAGSTFYFTLPQEDVQVPVALR